VYDWQFRSTAPLLVVNTSRQKSETVHIATLSRMSQTQTNALEVLTSQAKKRNTKARERERKGISHNTQDIDNEKHER
jgi:hypothetical protein